MIIRGKLSSLCHLIKRKIQKKKQIRSGYKKIGEEISLNINNIDEEQLDILVQKKSEFIELRNKRTEGVMSVQRSWRKAIKYFFNLENRNTNNKVINKLINEKGEEFYETKDILG